jgi:hypothetical protein
VSPPELSDPDERVIVEFPATAGYRGVGRLVLGGLSARFELPVDRVEDLLLALESLLSQELAADAVTMEAIAGPEGLRTRVGPFMRSQMEDAAVARVLNPLVDDVLEQDKPDGYWVELGVSAKRTAGVGG